MISRRPRIAIVGGGIGGMTAALCLAQRKFEVDVFEQAQTLDEVGAGIQLSPNCSGVLHSLGLERQLRAVACLPEATLVRDWQDGALLAQSVLGQTAFETYGSPYYHVHRADLMQALISKAGMSRNISIHTTAKVDAISLLDNGVSFSVNGEEQDTDIMIGADGIHSSVRQALFGPESPGFTGNVAYRALIPVNRIPAGLVPKATTVWWGPGCHFVHYLVKGGESVNCVCVVQQSGWEAESWTMPGDQAQLRDAFTGWHPTITTLIDAMVPAALFKWALFDRPPMPQWSRGHATLLGDACHPTLPFMAQGAAMAIEDAAVLALSLSRNLTRGESIPAAFASYEAARHERTDRIQRASRRNAIIYHLSGVSAWMRNRVAQRAAGSMMDWLYRYNPMA